MVSLDYIFGPRFLMEYSVVDRPREGRCVLDNLTMSTDNGRLVHLLVTLSEVYCGSLTYSGVHSLVVAASIFSSRKIRWHKETV
jgi:hypothetical protein